MDVIDRIFQLITENKTTAKALAEAIEVSTGNISDWKSRRSRPNIEVVPKIADYFLVTTDYLLMGKEDAPTLSEDTRELVEAYEQLDAQGKTIVKAKAIEELRRLEG